MATSNRTPSIRRKSAAPALEQCCPGVQCLGVYRNPRHWSEHESVALDLLGTPANFLSHGIVTEPMLEVLRRRAPHEQHIMFVCESRHISIGGCGDHIRVEIADSGDGASSLRGLLKGESSARIRLAAEARDLAWCEFRTHTESGYLIPLRTASRLRLIVDNTAPAVQP